VIDPARSYSPRRRVPASGRSLPDQGASGRLAGLGEAGDDLPEDARVELCRGDVVEEEEGAGAGDGDVVDAVVDQILANGVVLVGREGDLELGADAVDARDQRRDP